MASVDVDLIIEALSKGFDKLSKDLETVGKSSEKAGDGAEKGGKKVGFLQDGFSKLVASGVLLAAGKALLDFGKASITAASDVEEMQSKFNTVFKDLAGPVTQELETFAEAANRSKFDLMGFAATLQDTFVPLGFARDKAADMSVQLVKLAEDLASFNNLNTEDVVRDLQSALVGNTETLRKYGVVAQEAQIKQEALATGLWDGKGAIDAQSKAQAILQLTLKGTTDAQGDAIKTADSYANQTKGLEAAMTDLKVSIGTALLPVMSELVALATEVADRLTVASGVAGEYGNQVGTMIDGNIEAAKSFDELVAEGQKIAEVGDMWGGLASAVTGTEKAVIEGSRSTAAAMAVQADSFEQFSAGLDAAFGDSRMRSLFNVYLQQLGLSEQGFYDMARAQSVAADVASEAAAADAVLTQSLTVGTAAQEARTLAAIEYSAAAAEAAGINEDLADKTLQLANHTGTEEQAAIAANLANEQYFKTLEEEAQAAEEAAASQQLLAEQQADYFQQALDGKPVQDDLNQSIYDAAAASGATAEQLAILGGALGLYSDEAVEAALQSAAIQIKINELAQAYVDGKISVDEMRTGVQDFIAALNGVPDAVTTDVQVTGVDEAINKVGSLQAQLNQLGGQVSAAEAQGAVQKDGGGVGLAGGADFVVPPGYPNDSFGPIYVQSGEHVQVTPAGAMGGGAMGGGLQINGPLIGQVIQRANENGRAFADRVSTMVTEKIGSLK